MSERGSEYNQTLNWTKHKREGFFLWQVNSVKERLQTDPLARILWITLPENLSELETRLRELLPEAKIFRVPAGIEVTGGEATGGLPV